VSRESPGIQREFLLSLWKVEVLSRAEHGPVVGLWIIRDLRGRGHDVSPGTIYPLFTRMVERGWLACPDDPTRPVHARREYRITESGLAVLAELRAEVARLHEALNPSGRAVGSP
jgi:DNA-binding PadR family transcriptional regulator